MDFMSSEHMFRMNNESDGVYLRYEHKQNEPMRFMRKSTVIH